MTTNSIYETYFPFCTQAGRDYSMINKQRIQQLVLKNKPLNKAQIAMTISNHLVFLQNGGAGGQWKIVHLQGIVVALYFGPEASKGIQANFERQQFPKNVNLQKAVLPFSNFCASMFIAGDFQSADLSYSVLTDVEAENSNFKNAQLAYTDFTRANLKGVNFQNANLIGADFENCNLTGADFRGAILNQARFPGAILEEITI